MKLSNMTSASRLKLYRALVNSGRENLSDRGIATMIALSKDHHIQKHYSPEALAEQQMLMNGERVNRNGVLH